MLNFEDDRGNFKGLRVAIIDITARKKAEDALRQSEEQNGQEREKYQSLFYSIDEGFCIIQIIFDETGKAIDYRFLEINQSLERQTGLINAKGKRMRELKPKHEEHWFETYGRVALTGKSVRFQNRVEQLHRWYDVYAFPFGQMKNRFNLSIAELYIKKENPVLEIVKNAKNSSRRAGELTKQLLTFSKGGAPIKQTATIIRINRGDGRLFFKRIEGQM